MKIFSLFLICLGFTLCLQGQVAINIDGASTLDSSAMLEIKKSPVSKLRIRSVDLNDTAMLVLGNGINYFTEMKISANREEGLLISSLSDLAMNTTEEIMSIKPNGFVGIGLKNPNSRLHIHNPSIGNSSFLITNLNSGSDFGDGFLFMCSAPGALVMNRENGDLTFGTNNSHLMELNPLGNLRLLNSSLGISLNSPNPAPFITRTFDPFTSGIYSGLGRWGMFMESDRIRIGFPNIVNKGFDVVSYDFNSTVSNTLLTVLQNGNVGIGQSNPAYKLTVNGTINSPDLSGTGVRNLKVDANGTLTDVTMTNYINVPLFSFVKAVPSSTSILSYAAAGDLGLNFPPGVTDIVYAPVLLPHESRLVSMKIIYRDNSTQNLDISFNVTSQTIFGYTGIRTFTTSGAVASNQTSSIAFPPGNVVDNLNELYFIGIKPSIGNTWDGNLLYIKGIVLEVSQ